MYMASKSEDSDSSNAEQPWAEPQEQEHLPDSTREERIRRRAYEMYLERGGEPGHDLKDWLQAERELATDQSKSAGE
jgi:hypothetical protein